MPGMIPASSQTQSVEAGSMTLVPCYSSGGELGRWHYDDLPITAELPAWS